MRLHRSSWDGADAAARAAELRALQPPLAEVAEPVAELIARVREGGDAAVLEAERDFGAAEPASLAVPVPEIQAGAERAGSDVRKALAAAAENVRRVAEADIAEPSAVGIGPGHTVSLREVPVASAGAYAPGGGAGYPSTAVMCCVPAAVAGVDRLALASPPGADGRVPDAVLAAASLAGAGEVYAMGGVQAIAALALGTESVPAVDLVCGPGNRYVQEAKRQLVGTVGIDGIAGPSELMVVLDGLADPRQIALDLLAQAEHGAEGLLVAISPDPMALEAVAESASELLADRPTVADAPLVLIEAPSLEAAAALADALAPEHLELACADSAELAARIRYAGCVFTGPGGATAFGDYAAGSNHVLPTGGAGRHTGPLSPRAFRRRIATVELSAEAAGSLAPATATLARAEGFPVHGESAEARAPRQGS